MRIGRRRQKVTHLISRAEKARLRELIEQIDRETTAEICVMLLDDAEEPSEFARKYFDHLGIGKRELHNGILILVVVAKRQIEAVVGKGLREVAPQAFREQVINDIMVTDFRAGRTSGRCLRASAERGYSMPHRLDHRNESKRPTNSRN